MTIGRQPLFGPIHSKFLRKIFSNFFLTNVLVLIEEISVLIKLALEYVHKNRNFVRL